MSRPAAIITLLVLAVMLVVLDWPLWTLIPGLACALAALILARIEWKAQQ